MAKHEEQNKAPPAHLTLPWELTLATCPEELYSPEGFHSIGPINICAGRGEGLEEIEIAKFVHRAGNSNHEAINALIAARDVLEDEEETRSLAGKDTPYYKAAAAALEKVKAAIDKARAA